MLSVSMPSSLPSGSHVPLQSLKFSVEMHNNLLNSEVCIYRIDFVDMTLHNDSFFFPENLWFLANPD